MRSFELTYLLIFFGFFSILGFASMLSFGKIIKKSLDRSFKCIFLLIHFLIFAGFFLMYVYPFNIRDGSVNYSFYSVFNALLLILFIVDLVMSFALILNFISNTGKTKIFIYIGSIISAGITGGIVTGTLWGTNKFKINEIELAYSNLPPDFNGFRILQISDIHLGNINDQGKLIKKAIKLIENADHDILVFAGDLVNNFYYETEEYLNLFRELTSCCPSYSILGNHDYGDYTYWKSDTDKKSNFDAIISAHETMGFKLLRNENRVIKNKNDSIFIVGVENWGHPPFPQYADLDKALEGITAGSFTVLLTHDPAHWESCIENKKDIELTLSGHTHGLQWGIKIAGIPFSLAWLTRKYWGGLYSSYNSHLYVNTGLGTIGLPWRIDMPPEITLITLKRVEVD